MTTGSGDPKPRDNAQGTLVRRRLSFVPEFHETDMMGVVHNAAYILWFERGRFQFIMDILPVDEACELGILLPVVENACRYERPARFGEPLELHTSHRVTPVYHGRLIFEHHLVRRRDRATVATGHSTMTLMDRASNRLLKEWPQHVWDRYQALPANNDRD